MFCCKLIVEYNVCDFIYAWSLIISDIILIELFGF
jgi:hypothetical protein